MKLRKLKNIAQKAKQLRENHRERHRPTGFGFALADSVDFLNASHWDSVTANKTVFLSRDYLRALETAGPENSRQRYALIYRGRTPVAAVSAQAVKASASSVPKSELRRSIAVPLKRVEQNILVCGNLLSWGCHGVAFGTGEDPSVLWPAVAEALYRIRRADQLQSSTDLIMVKDVPGHMMNAAGALKRISYRPLETEPNMVLSLSPQWRTFEDYLAALTANYRKVARKTIEQIKAAGCSVETLDNVAERGSHLHALYLQVHHRQKMRLVSLHQNFIPTLASTFQDRFRCTVLKKGEDLLGFVTTLKDGETAVGYYIGFDTEANREMPVYFRLLQAVVDDAIQMGCRQVSFGRTALEPKARLGAKPDPFHIWVRHRVPAMNVLVRSLLHAIPHDEAPERSPFKPVAAG
jgi:predicted N-acyltransferase